MNILLTQQEQRLLWEINGPVLQNSIDLCQVLRLPLLDSTQQQVKKSTSFVTAVTLLPEESLFILRQAEKRVMRVMYWDKWAGNTRGICWIYLYNYLSNSLHSQAEAVLLRNTQHLFLQRLTWLGEYDRSRKSYWPLIHPLDLTLELQLDRWGQKWIQLVMCCHSYFCQQRAEWSSITNLQYDTHRLCVMFIDGWRGTSWDLSLCRQTEQDCPWNQCPEDRGRIHLSVTTAQDIIMTHTPLKFIIYNLYFIHS